MDYTESQENQYPGRAQHGSCENIMAATLSLHASFEKTSEVWHKTEPGQHYREGQLRQGQRTKAT